MDKLLLIDDEDDVRYSFKRIFSSPALNLETAASGAEGLKVIHRFQPDRVLIRVPIPLTSSTARNPDARFGPRPRCGFRSSGRPA